LEETACFVDEVHLFFEDGAGGVAREDQECADGTLSGVEVFVETAGCSRLLDYLFSG
jgi:hypothetical protein